MSYVTLQGWWYHIIVLHAPTEDKSGDKKGGFYGQLEHAFYQFPKYQMKTLLGAFNVKVRTKYIESNNQELKFT
jgi:hypothetical protein